MHEFSLLTFVFTRLFDIFYCSHCPPIPPTPLTCCPSLISQMNLSHSRHLLLFIYFFFFYFLKLSLFFRQLDWVLSYSRRPQKYADTHTKKKQSSSVYISVNGGGYSFSVGISLFLCLISKRFHIITRITCLLALHSVLYLLAVLLNL